MTVKIIINTATATTIHTSAVDMIFHAFFIRITPLCDPGPYRKSTGLHFAVSSKAIYRQSNKRPLLSAMKKYLCIPLHQNIIAYLFWKSKSYSQTNQFSTFFTHFARKKSFKYTALPSFLHWVQNDNIQRNRRLQSKKTANHLHAWLAVFVMRPFLFFACSPAAAKSMQ